MSEQYSNEELFDKIEGHVAEAREAGDSVQFCRLPDPRDGTCVNIGIQMDHNDQTNIIEWMFEEMDTETACAAMKALATENVNIRIACEYATCGSEYDRKDGEDVSRENFDGARWEAIIDYRKTNGSFLIETWYMAELDMLGDIIEQGPHWDTVAGITVYRVNHNGNENLTIEQAEQL